MDDFLGRYLTRVGLAGPQSPDAQGLAAVQLAQVMTIPFENLDPFLHRPVDLTPAAIDEKILVRRRGGYCFELNSLYQRALIAQGFAVRAMTGRVHYGRPAPGARTHHVLRVTIGGQDWLADASFGGLGLRLPMPLEVGHEVVQASDLYRLERHAELGYLLRRRTRGEWIDLYSFLGDEALPIDFEMGNHFTATWPNSPFRRMLLCNRPIDGGRVTLFDRTLTVESGGAVVRTAELGVGAAIVALRDELGLQLDEVLEAGIRQRLSESLPTPIA
jgi:N-hydroxyarylamine O-acetyltransferase